IGSIAIRILTFQDEAIDYDFWKRRITNAWKMRQNLGLTDSATNNVYRLIHGEGDHLPGLIVDYYAGVAVVQFHSIGMYLEKENITQALLEVMGNKLTAIYDKSESTLPYKAAITPQNGYLYGTAENFIAMENGLKFNVDWLEGQKTGFFIDQRENRSLLEKYAKDKKVLNMFCYTGGFSVYALRGGAKQVHSVDVSARAIELTKQNVALNFPDDSRHEAFTEEAFKFLENSYHKYDLIILDPPAFAKHQNVLNNAIQGYKKLNRKGIEIVKPGGIIFTFSCSQVMTKELFRQTVFTAAANTGRKVRILHQLTQPADHPVNIYHPEGEYLKGLVLYVE
ncbi:MAG: class I SAM-dependent rRNA methyltransferase, partial [Odoribacter sp.]|nr:class I SAM-dependent rRNA methyltransferase [Odoribacter sp.]